MSEPSSSSLSWEADGPAGAPAIVLLHGAILSRAMWGPLVGRLRDRYRCVTVDLPGHGAMAGEPYSLDGAVRTVHRAIDEAAAGRALVVGLSLGGYSGIAAAAASPPRVRGLVVAGTSVEPVGLASLAYVWYGWSLRLLPADLVRDVGVALFRRAYGRAVGAAVTRGYDSRGGASGVLAVVGERFRERIRSYGGPVLVVNGDLDPWFRLGERRFVEGLPNVEVVRLAGASHVSSLDRPDEFAAAVAEFEATCPA